jgi:hypothetical protein
VLGVVPLADKLAVLSFVVVSLATVLELLDGVLDVELVEGVLEAELVDGAAAEAELLVSEATVELELVLGFVAEDVVFKEDDGVLEDEGVCAVSELVELREPLPLTEPLALSEPLAVVVEVSLVVEDDGVYGVVVLPRLEELLLVVGLEDEDVALVSALAVGLEDE